jgi:hypothetical protein
VIVNLTYAVLQEQQMSAIAQLASSCALPAAVAHSHDLHHSKSEDAVQRAQLLKGNSNVQIAPYQALPVAGPVAGLITHHKATALNIQEPGTDMSEEVRFPGCLYCTVEAASLLFPCSFDMCFWLSAGPLGCSE